MKTIDNIIIWGDPIEEDAVRQIRDCAKTGVKAALMADHHVGYSMPIGGVVAYDNAVSPSGVGYDIGCGNKAVRLDIPADEVRKNISRIMDDIVRQISFGMGRNNNERVDHPLFDDPVWRLPALKSVRQKAQNQLGTVGGGNHYVDIFIDDLNRVWVGVHFGSRGLGHHTATYYLKAGGGKDGMFVPPTVFKLGTSLGDDYMAAMEVAGKYAYAGRDWVCDKVASILKAHQVESIHNHHNYAWREVHDGQELIVVRKGATPAFPGQKGFVGGSMGDISVILEGVESKESSASLYSTVHGAGRVMSRRKAAGKYNRKLRRYEGGEVTREMMDDWVTKAGVTLRGGGLDESPHVYKRLPKVLKEHKSTIRILNTLTPIGVAMAGDDIFDPYKD
ncbi:RtcB family protein [Kamptonema cortianum]|nr:RtcB family protein [Geitlerinema splendidum]MDK3156883.1 RtcB family protein [Kamptonema cortianum]